MMPEYDKLFAGVHFVFNPQAGHRWEAYAYRLSDSRDIYEPEGEGGPGELRRDSFGFRYLYSEHGWKAGFYRLEIGPQEVSERLAPREGEAEG